MLKYDVNTHSVPVKTYNYPQLRCASLQLTSPLIIVSYKLRSPNHHEWWFINIITHPPTNFHDGIICIIEWCIVFKEVEHNNKSWFSFTLLCESKTEFYGLDFNMLQMKWYDNRKSWFIYQKYSNCLLMGVISVIIGICINYERCELNTVCLPWT